MIDFIGSNIDYETTQKDGLVKVFDLSKENLSTLELIKLVTQNSVS